MGVKLGSYTATSPTVQSITPDFTLDRTLYDLPKRIEKAKATAQTLATANWLGRFARETTSENVTPPTTNKLSSLKGYTPKNGDVVEIKNKNHTYGHTATYHNGKWYSDFGLVNMDPYSDSQYSTYRIFRNPNSEEAAKGAAIVASRAKKSTTGRCAKYVREGFEIASGNKGKYKGESYNGKDFGDYLSKKGWALVAKQGGILKALEGIKWGSFTEVKPSWTPKPMQPTETLDPVYNSLPLPARVTNKTINRNANNVKYDVTKKPEEPKLWWESFAKPTLGPSTTKSMDRTKIYMDLEKLIKDSEGGWSDDKNDRGGKTYKGVTLKTFKSIFGNDKTENDLRNITDEQWRKVMSEVAWKPSGAAQVNNASIAKLIADWAWASGTTGIKKMQEALGVLATGHVGEQTLAALNQEDSKKVFDTLWDARKRHFIGIAQSNPSLQRFLNGWLNRLNKFTYE